MTGQVNSYFKIELKDGSFRDERDCSWSSISEHRIVNCFGNKKGVMVCKLPVKKIEVFHEDLHDGILVPENCEVYQAIRSESIITPNYGRNDRIVGRYIGILENGKVIEERFLNALENSIQGMRL